MKKCLVFLVFLVIALAMVGCGTTQQRLLDSDQNQLMLRSIQSRIFDTAEKEKTLRTVIATLQDLGFVVDRADYTLGTVTGTKLNYYNLKMTVSLRPRGDSRTLIRANAQYGLKPVVEPKPYQDFFVSLEKAMFLTAHQVD
jgi:hypothetical protein